MGAYHSREILREDGTYMRTPLVNIMRCVQVPTGWSITIKLEQVPTLHFTKFVQEQLHSNSVDGCVLTTKANLHAE